MPGERRTAFRAARAAERRLSRALERWWCELANAALRRARLPFSGGWFVYLGYELAGEIEPRLRLPPSPDPIGALAIRAPAAWIRDRATRRAWLVAEAGHEATARSIRRGCRGTRGARAPARTPPPRFDARGAASAFSARFAVRSSTSAAGDVYQTNLSRRWWGASRAPIDPVAMYARLRTTNPSPFAALLRHGDFAIVSSSPERLLAIRGACVVDATDRRHAAARRDAERRCGADSLAARQREGTRRARDADRSGAQRSRPRLSRRQRSRVDEYMTSKRYAHVHHIVSNVSGRLRDGVSPIDAIRAVFPGGTITGCPKVRCMQIIAELEGEGRGAYTGSLGYLNRDGSCDFNILIRTHQRPRAVASPCAPAPASSPIRSRRRNWPRRAPRRRAAARPGGARRERLGQRPERRRRIDWRDRGLQYGDGLFETMRVRRGARSPAGLPSAAAGRRLRAARGSSCPMPARLRREIARAAALRDDGVLKLIVTRGVGARGYRPPARERTTRILSARRVAGARGARARPLRCTCAFARRAWARMNAWRA